MTFNFKNILFTIYSDEGLLSVEVKESPDNWAKPKPLVVSLPKFKKAYEDAVFHDKQRTVNELGEGEGKIQFNYGARLLKINGIQYSFEETAELSFHYDKMVIFLEFLKEAKLETKVISIKGNLFEVIYSKKKEIVSIQSLKESECIDKEFNGDSFGLSSLSPLNSMFKEKVFELCTHTLESFEFNEKLIFERYSRIDLLTEESSSKVRKMLNDIGKNKYAYTKETGFSLVDIAYSLREYNFLTRTIFTPEKTILNLLMYALSVSDMDTANNLAYMIVSSDYFVSKNIMADSTKKSRLLNLRVPLLAILIKAMDKGTSRLDDADKLYDLALLDVIDSPELEILFEIYQDKQKKI